MWEDLFRAILILKNNSKKIWSKTKSSPDSLKCSGSFTASNFGLVTLVRKYSFMSNVISFYRLL